jgi:hypothetical protein
LSAKEFSDWSNHIVASICADVNDSEAVDAFGKVENSQSKTPADFSGWEKIKKGRSKLRPWENKIPKTQVGYSSFLTVTFTFEMISRCSFTGIS